jgi:hypothetical protein
MRVAEELAPFISAFASVAAVTVASLAGVVTVSGSAAAARVRCKCRRVPILLPVLKNLQVKYVAPEEE